jgi:octaprenyl-diphosphate synthase
MSSPPPATPFLMRDQLSSESEVVQLIGQHVLGSGGKRVRPALLILAAELCGYTGPRRVHVAAAVELLHTATLLHDDVIDLAVTRRGRSAANVIWGNRRAVLMGDFLLARASTMIVEDGDLEILWVFSDTIRRMAEGEILQMQKSFDPEISEGHYFQVIDRKSAVLLSAACQAGAILGGVTRAERRHIVNFGREVGLAFQLRDDALDYTAAAEELGKSAHADVREGKVTLPLLLALKRCAPAEREQIVGILKAASRRASDAGGLGSLEETLPDEELQPLLDLVTRYHGVEDTLRRAREHADHARRELDPFPAGSSKEALLEAADFAVARAA